MAHQTPERRADIVYFRLKLCHPFHLHVQFTMDVRNLIVDTGEFSQAVARRRGSKGVACSGCPPDPGCAFRSTQAGLSSRPDRTLLPDPAGGSWRPRDATFTTLAALLRFRHFSRSQPFNEPAASIDSPFCRTIPYPVEGGVLL
jgi:hypothetical protein